ncbi:MAG: hypothetical protein HQL72_08905 [Magnetococcales bacterium]|nr:hypothetical protein [Magnetococcales bacterium]
MAEEDELEGGAPEEAAPEAEAKEEAKAPEKKGSAAVLIVFLVLLLGGFGATFMFLDEKVQVSIKNLDRVWADKQIELRSMARQRMYDTSQSHLQTEMMDRWRNAGRGGVEPGQIPSKP